MMKEEQVARQWESVMKVSRTVEHRVIEGIDNLEKQGYDVSEAKKLIELGNEAYERGDYWRLLKIIAMISEALRRAPKLVTDIYKPDTWEELKRSWRVHECFDSYEASLGNQEYYDKVYGGWYGKAIGVSLGDPVAGWPSSKVKKTYGKILRYIKEPDTRNDDINYQLVVLHCIEEHGVEFTSRDLGYEWVEHIPVESSYTAERVALENLIRGIIPPYSARENNPFADWIGAQMRGEVHGLIAPGRPAVAAKFAYRDAVISHVKEGVYGEIFNAVMVSLAFVLRDVERIIHSALSYVPQNSEFHSVVSSTYRRCSESNNWESVLDWINQTYGHFHWIHTLPNIAIVTMSLLFGGGDFSESIRICASSGWDSDCTTGQVGAITGVIVGERGIPGEWKCPLGESLNTEVRGFNQIRYSDLARWTCKIGEKVAKGTLTS